MCVCVCSVTYAVVKGMFIFSLKMTCVILCRIAIFEGVDTSLFAGVTHFTFNIFGAYIMCRAGIRSTTDNTFHPRL